MCSWQVGKIGAAHGPGAVCVSAWHSRGKILVGLCFTRLANLGEFAKPMHGA
jgi:hypothetical protein